MTPWYCYRHEKHSIDEVCTDCEAESPEAALAEAVAFLRRAESPHHPDCTGWLDSNDSVCTCGLRAFLKKHAPKEGAQS